MQVRLTAAQWTLWQDNTTAGTNFRAGFLQGAAACISPDVYTVELQQPNGTLISTFVRQSTWVSA